MAWDLAITEDGSVYLCSTRPLRADVERVVLLCDQRLLRIDYTDGDDELLDHELGLELTQPLQRAAKAIVVALNGLIPVAGFRVDLVKQ